MKTIQSKRFWLNVFTVITMVGSITNVLSLSPEATKWVTFSVALSNIILQVWFNQDKKTNG